MLLCPQILFLMVAKQLPAAREICFLFMSRERRVTTHRSLCSLRTTTQKGPGALSLVLVAELNEMLDPEHWGFPLSWGDWLNAIALLQVGGEGTAASMHYEFVVQSSMRVNRISILDQSGPGVAQRQCSEISVTVRSGPRMVPKGHQHLTNRERGACESEFLTSVYPAWLLWCRMRQEWWLWDLFLMYFFFQKNN